jgi:hypothetical protein
MLTRLASLGQSHPAAPASPRQRRVALLLTALVAAMSVLFWPSQPANADPAQCTPKQWSQPANIPGCIKRLPAVNQPTSDCMGIPTPSAPDSGFGGWFATNPKLGPGVTGMYSEYGYSGYEYPLYSPNCVNGVNPVPTSNSTTTTIANGELMVSTGIIGAANAFRDKAYNPASMWGWADKLVNTATKAIYQKVFSVFGVVTLAVVGLYLIWRSRQSDMSDALTTAGWAVLVMVVVTAVAMWPVNSAHLADNTLISSLGVVHDAVGPQPKDIPTADCPFAQQPPLPGIKFDPSLCKDKRPPALRASDTATQTILYDNWLRGTLGSATSTTAQKYGAALYDASALSWTEYQTIQQHPDQRATILQKKSENWQRIANQIKSEDPDAYNYLQGNEGSARIGAGLIAIISALGFGFFDVAASLLIILGFLIFRWAVVALPVIGTIALLRPASGGFKRLVNIVVAAVFNIIIFGVGGSVYLFAVDLILNASALPGWLQLTLIWLCGVVGWLLLRPYRRITQLGGKNSFAEVASIGSWHRKFFGDLKGVALAAAGSAVMGDVEAGKETKAKGDRRTETTGDPGQPARRNDTREVPVPTGDGSDGPIPTEPAPSETPPEKQTPDSPAESPPPARRPRTGEPVGAGQRSGPGYSDGYAANSRDDDKVWVPDTGRYANGERTDADVAASVGRANQEISAYADDADRENRDYYQRAHSRT